MEPRAFGSWPSTISAEQLVAQSLRLSEPRWDGEYLYWLESRPEEKGRNCLVRCKTDGLPEDVIPSPINIRSKANEYGGGAYCVADGVVFFVQADDQRIYRFDTNLDAPYPEPISRDVPFRFAELTFDPHRQRLLAVREDHSLENKEETASIISIDAQGRDCFTLTEGADFYSSISISPSGQFIAWLSWKHPAMPWTDNQCTVAELNHDGTVMQMQVVAGSECGQPAQALFQPLWDSKDELYLISDYEDWWRLYSVDAAHDAGPQLRPVLAKPPESAEFGTPQWVFGLSTWGFINDNTLIATYSQHGYARLCLIDVLRHEWQDIDTPWTQFSAVVAQDGRAAVLAANYTDAGTIAIWQNGANGRDWQYVRSAQSDLDSATLSRPKAIHFGPTGQTAFAFYYPPYNGVNTGLEGEKPPLIVLAHGGPTAQANTALNIKIQYWCSRGFAVVDVNYRGSTGYGREYRLSLDGQWGVADVQDVCRAANHLVEQGLADANRLTIKGSSAGGYTVLAALTFTDTFKAGASLYGIGDLETLVLDTHKFESRYLDHLVGPYPDEIDTYHERSPIHHVKQLNCPVIFFQGDEDKVVPPNQAEAMVNALKEKGIPVAYVVFNGEGHGFRQGQNIVRAIEAELYFYSQIFGFELAEAIEPVAIENSNNL